MNPQSYFYNCSPEYIHTIDAHLYDQIVTTIEQLLKRQTQSEINADLFWLFSSKRWCYDSILKGVRNQPPLDLPITLLLDQAKEGNNRKICLTATTLDTRWHSDYAKSFGLNLVQVETQFGKVEAMFKDFCGFRIAYSERRLALGIEVVLSNPNKYFAHRRNAIGGMASFNIAKDTLNTIGLDCPIWLVGIRE
jgi:hypothetical protein